MTKFIEICKDQFVSVDACIQQLSSKDKRAVFQPEKTELLGHSVFKWIIKVSFFQNLI